MKKIIILLATFFICGSAFAEKEIDINLYFNNPVLNRLEDDDETYSFITEKENGSEFRFTYYPENQSPFSTGFSFSTGISTIDASELYEEIYPVSREDHEGISSTISAGPSFLIQFDEGQHAIYFTPEITFESNFEGAKERKDFYTYSFSILAGLSLDSGYRFIFNPEKDFSIGFKAGLKTTVYPLCYTRAGTYDAKEDDETAFINTINQISTETRIYAGFVMSF